MEKYAVVAPSLAPGYMQGVLHRQALYIGESQKKKPFPSTPPPPPVFW